MGLLAVLSVHRRSFADALANGVKPNHEARFVREARTPDRNTRRRRGRQGFRH
jgi:hypothetical protein